MYLFPEHQANSPSLHIYNRALLPPVSQTVNKGFITWLISKDPSVDSEKANQCLTVS